MKITLRQLAYFDALARERHFGRAASRVSVSQPAMSAQIRDLEALLGGALVDRSTNRIALTPLGRTVAERATAVLSGATEIEALGRAALPGRIRLGLIPTVAPYLVPPFLAVLDATGSVTVQVSEALTARLIDQVRSGDLDAGVIALPSGASDLAEEPLFRDLFLLATPLTPDRNDPIAPGRPEEIDPARLLLLDEGHCLADQSLAACSIRRDALRQSFGATSLTTVSRLVASGQGVTLIPELAAEVEGRGLNLTRFGAPEPGRTVGLVYRPGAREQGWTTQIAEWLKAARHPHSAA